MASPNPYLEYCTPSANTAPPAPATTAETLPTLFAPKHSFNFGPLNIDCDLDPSDGVMGVTCSLLGFVFMQQQFTAKDGTVGADCARGPFNVHVQLTPSFANHSMAYSIKLCLLTNCVNLAGNLGGYTPAPTA